MWFYCQFYFRTTKLQISIEEILCLLQETASTWKYACLYAALLRVRIRSTTIPCQAVLSHSDTHLWTEQAPSCSGLVSFAIPGLQQPKLTWKLQGSSPRFEPSQGWGAQQCLSLNHCLSVNALAAGNKIFWATFLTLLPEKPVVLFSKLKWLSNEAVKMSLQCFCLLQ